MVPLEIVVWVIILREQTLISVCEGNNRLTLSHPEVRQLCEGVKQAHIINLSECFNRRFVGSSNLLAANSIFLLAGQSFEKPLSFVMVQHRASLELPVDGLHEVVQICLAPHLFRVRMGNF